VLQALDGALIRRWARAGLEALGHAREEIDALNVYPVPDGDTGTNLFLTMEAAAEAAEAVPGDAEAPDVLRALARGALLGARGNSGVILSQLLKGVADVLCENVAPGRPVGADVYRAALARAADLGYAAVAQPVEGTILTVARVAAEAAAASPSDDPVEVVRAAADGAREAVDRTPEQLEILARAGVVDAGGRGLSVLLDASAGALAGITRMSPPRAHVPVVSHVAGADLYPGGPAFEVMYLLDAPDENVPRLKQALAVLGDSLVVVGGDGLWNVHVHVDDVGAAIEPAVAAGRPYRIRVTHFADVAARQAGERTQKQRAIVALAPGPGVASLLREAGAVVVEARPRRRPSTGQLFNAIRRAQAAEVVVLPNDADSRAVAEAAADQARADGVRVAVIPTHASVQALAALAVHEPGRRFDDDVVTMTSAAGATRSGEITVAVREAMTMAGVCRAGDVLGLIDGDVAVIGADPTETARTVLERMLSGGGELVTLIRGDAAPPGLLEELTKSLHTSRPDVECVTYEGGQPDYPLLIGVE
jgi:DAK2 domain fusion protein YloV